MIAIAIASRDEWKTTKDYFNKSEEEIKSDAFVQYFFEKIENIDVLIYYSGFSKVQSSSAAQLVIDRFGASAIIVAGTCAGIDPKFQVLDIFLPNKLVQHDCTVRSIEPLIKEKFNVDLDLSKFNFEYSTGVIATGDRPIVDWNDYLDLLNNGVTIADMESACVGLVCKLNNVECIVIKGISDFPHDNYHSDKSNAFEKQANTYVENVPFVMKKIFDNYLPKIISALK